ncbi:predicted protein [Nematostella vectensis]|uniref:Single-stranded DNA-binding protein, mitochondrial n=1 Tax=Nematostella vectensis TaxID=45351 RepID=A7SEZ5_NEMVE|nr:predicted protein [Nematostella vectensis]|eukprot:XP_001629785.1 predicted protein [Nematostella vectensis]
MGCLLIPLMETLGYCCYLARESNLGVVTKEDRLEDVSRKSFETGLNSVQLIGYTGADPQSFGTDSHSGTRLSLATTSYYRTKDDKLHSKTSWHNISIFKPSLQEKVNLHVRRGSRLFVQGSLDYTSYVDQDGQKKYSTSIIPNDIIILNSRPSPEEEEDF